MKKDQNASPELTCAQRIAIRTGRDEDRCHFPHYLDPRIDCTGRLEVHHALPKRFATVALGIENPHIPEVLITICNNSHEHIHPDMRLAKRAYHMDQNSYKNMCMFRDEDLRRGKAYWITKYDNELLDIANERCEIKRTEGWIFPTGRINTHQR